MTYHEAFRKKTTEYSAKIDNADTDVSALALEINDFAKDWLSHHILVADKQYVTFFKQNKID